MSDTEGFALIQNEAAKTVPVVDYEFSIRNFVSLILTKQDYRVGLALGKRDRHASVIVMSGNSIGKSFLRSARIIGARASLIKPFIADELRQVVERVLKGDSIS